MGFNTEVSRIRSGLKSGKYRNKPNLAKAFMDPFIKGIERQELERIQKDKEDRARAAAAAKAAAAEQRAKEKADAKAQDMVNFILMTNPEIQATEAINKQLFTLAKTGDFKDAGAFQTFIDENATFNPPTTEKQPISKIEMAPPFRIDQGVGKLNSTTFQSTTGDFTGKKRPLTSLDVPRLAKRDDESGDVAQQMIDSGLNPQQVGEPLGEKEVNVGPTLTFGKNNKSIDTSKLRPENWYGTYQQLLKKGDTANALLVDEWAKSTGNNFVTAGVTANDLQGKSSAEIAQISLTTGEGGEDALKPYIEAAREAEALGKVDFWTDLEAMAKVEEPTLLLELSKHKEGSEPHSIISAQILMNEAVKNSNNLGVAAASLDKDEAFYNTAIKRYAALASKPNIPQTLLTRNAENLINLQVMSILSRDQRLNKEAIDFQGLTMKQLSAKAFMVEGGFGFIDPSTGKIKMPTTAQIIKYEKDFKEATTLASKADTWADAEKVAKLDLSVLQVMKNLGILDDTQLTLVDSAIATKTGQVTVEANADALNFDGVKTMDDLNLKVANAGFETFKNPDGTINQAAVDKLSRVRATLEKIEGKPEEAEKFTTAYAAAFSDFISRPETEALSGPDLVRAMAEFERDWKDNSAKTEKEPDPEKVSYDNNSIVGMIVDARNKIRSPNADEQAVGNAFINNELPDILNAKITLEGLNSEAAIQLIMSAGVDRNTATLIHTKALSVKSDPVTGNPVAVNIANLPENSSGMRPTDPIVVDALSVRNAAMSTPQITSVLEMSPEDIASSDAVLQGGHQSIIKKLGFDPSVSMGNSGFFGNIINKGTSLVGWTPFKDVASGIDYMKALNNTAARILSVAVEGSRDSVYNKQRLMEILPEAAKFMTTDFDAKTAIDRTVDTLQGEIENLSIIVNDPAGKTNPKQKAEAYAKSLQMGAVLDGYKAVQLAFDQAIKNYDLSDYNIVTEPSSSQTKPATTPTYTAEQLRAEKARREAAKANN